MCTHTVSREQPVGVERSFSSRLKPAGVERSSRLRLELSARVCFRQSTPPRTSSHQKSVTSTTRPSQLPSLRKAASGRSSAVTPSLFPYLARADRRRRGACGQERPHRENVVCERSSWPPEAACKYQLQSLGILGIVSLLDTRDLSLPPLS